MAHLIDKDALVAEIERRKEKCDTFYNIALSNNAEFAKVVIEEQKRQHDGLLSFLDTLEVKEVDLEKEYEEFVVDDPILNVFIQNDIMGMKVAKHFFELGLNASNPLTWEDIANINDIVDEIVKECDNNILYDTREYFCKEVLKRFKEQKGESQ